MAAPQRTKCPACGTSLAPTLLPRCPRCKCFLRFGKVTYSDEFLARLDDVIQKSSFPADAFEFMISALRRAFATARLHGIKQLDARAICDAVRQFANVRYGEQSVEALRAWGVHSSLEVGELVIQLAQAGFCSLPEGDYLAGYHKVYTVGDHAWNTLQLVRGVCGNCGYDLRGSPGYRCPECGAQITQPATPPEDHRQP